MRTAPTFSSTKSNYYPDGRTDGRTDERTSVVLVPRMEKALRAIIQTAGSIFEKLSGDGRYAMVALTWGGWVRSRWSAASKMCLVKLVIVPNIRNFRDSCLLILAFLAVFASKCIFKAQGHGSDVSDH